MEKVKELRVTVRQFLTKPNSNYPDRVPVPMRTMFGYTTHESTNGIYMVLKGKPEPSEVCLHCGRELTHPVSVLYGIGPTCGKHFHINPLESEEALSEAIEEIRSKLSDVVWEGWLPKAYIDYTETGEEIEPFGQKSEPEPETKEVTGRIYPELSVEQEALIESSRLKWLDDTSKPKPTDIWMAKDGVIKVVFVDQGNFEKKTSYKIDRAGNILRTSIPYSPKYNLLSPVRYFGAVEEEKPKKPKPPVKVNEEVVDELVNELSGLFS